jgi:sugar (pentulose or hexulose) kinase
VKEATSLGAAFCALVATGEFENVNAAARSSVKWERTVEPDPHRARQYDGLREQQRLLQSNLKIPHMKPLK